MHPVPFLGFTINIPLQKAINNDKVRSRNKAKKLVTKFETQEQIILGRNVVNISLPINKDFYKNHVIEHDNTIFTPNSLIRRDYIDHISKEGIPIYDSQLNKHFTNLWSNSLFSDKTSDLSLMPAIQSYTYSNCSAWDCYYERMPFPTDGSAYAHHEQSNGGNPCESVVWVNGSTYVLQFADENWCPPEYYPEPPIYPPRLLAELCQD